jgi:hypothetical protein
MLLTALQITQQSVSRNATCNEFRGSHFQRTVMKRMSSRRSSFSSATATGFCSVGERHSVPKRIAPDSTGIRQGCLFNAQPTFRTHKLLAAHMVRTGGESGNRTRKLYRYCSLIARSTLRSEDLGETFGRHNLGRMVPPPLEMSNSRGRSALARRDPSPATKIGEPPRIGKKSSLINLKNVWRRRTANL